MADSVAASAAPFERIALSLSGGGYRAAAFHLGTLDLLHRVGLLPRVAILSTVSGGTLTGCRYAVSLARGESFEQFHRSLFDYLCRVNVVARAFATLSSAPRGSRRGSLITAAADLYGADEFLGAARFGSIAAGAGHLEEITFNATEFQSGVAFRFQVSRNPAARIGNGNVWMKASLLNDVRLADIVAASSCFPGAFEPIGFPGDFVWPGGAFPPSRRNELSHSFPDLLPLMDGGIYDNQGIDGLLLANARSSEPADLFVVSDTQQKRASLYEMRAAPPPHGPRLRTLFRLGQLLCVLLAASAGALGYQTARSVVERSFRTGDLLTSALPFAVTLVLALALPFGWRWIRRKLQDSVPSVSADFWKGLAGLRTPHAVDLAILRLKSSLAIMTDVFMKRIRTLGYDKLLRDPALGALSITNLIYDMDRARAAAVPSRTPSAAQLEAMGRAMDVKTQLWFDDPRDAVALVACGQSTICFNLLEWLDAHGHTPAHEALSARLQGLWAQLQREPLSLVRQAPAASDGAAARAEPRLEAHP